MAKFHYHSIGILIAVLLSGCAIGAHFTASEVPVSPVFDTEIVSVEYYIKTKNYNCLQRLHSMSHEQAVSNLKSICSKAKKLNENDYILSIDEIEGFEKQKCDYCCWASCLQYLSLAHFGKFLSQQKLMLQIKQKKLDNNLINAADAGEIIKSIWHKGVTIIPGGGAEALLNSLAHNNPVMVGLLPQKDTDPGHAVIVIGTRFSYAFTADPPCRTCTHYAFSEFTILNPATGQKEIVKASVWDKRVGFILYFSLPG